MARFLSAAWFNEIESAGAAGGAGTDGNQDPAERLVMEQVVTGTPDGEVSYLVVVEGKRARVVRPSSGATLTEADLTITCDWPTATAIAQGHLSTQRALMQGRLRVRGSPAALLQRGAQLAGLDPIPAAIRKNTTY
jgi:SCP-2 sterol transfer family